MPRFFYEVVDTLNHTVEGIMEAPSAAEAEKLLNRTYLMISALKPLEEVDRQKLASVETAPEPDPSPASSPPGAAAVTPVSRVAPEQVVGDSAPRRMAGRGPLLGLTLFTRRMAAMMEAGIPVGRALLLLAQAEENRRLRGVLHRVHQGMESGRPLAACMREHPDIFPALFVTIVRTGEQTGTLEPNLKRMGHFLDKALRLHQRFRNALAYPLVLGATAAFVASLFAQIVVPRMEDLLGGTGTPIPVVTRMLIELVDVTAIKYTWIPLMVVCCVVALVATLMVRSDGGRRRVDGALLRLPLIGNVLRKAAAARMLYALAILLESGTTVGPQLGVVGKVAGNQVLEDQFREAVGIMVTGSSMFAAFAAVDLFPQSTLQMLRAGEESGLLVATLGRAAGLFDEEVDLAAGSLARLVELIVLGGVGLLVGFLSLALGMPTIELLQRL